MNEQLPQQLEQLIELHTAGSPTCPEVKWTDLKPAELAKAYEEKWSGKISHGTIKRVLKDLGYKKRRPNKSIATGKSPHRAAQFRLIFYFAFLFSEMDNNPILSMDTKKKEELGELSRSGKVLCKEAPKVHDHDYKHLSKGKVVPGGLYDMKRQLFYAIT